MNISADINIFPATALNELEKPHSIELNTGIGIFAPTLFPYEIANVLTVLVKRYSLFSESQKPRLRRLRKSWLNALIFQKLLDISFRLTCILMGCFLQCAQALDTLTSPLMKAQKRFKRIEYRCLE